MLNTKKLGLHRQFFFQIYIFYNCGKTGHIDLPEKTAPTKLKCYLPVYQILQNYRNARKFTFSFAFCAHVDNIKVI